MDDILKLLIKNPEKLCFFEVCFDKPKDLDRLAQKIKEAGLAERSYILTFSNKKHLLKRAKKNIPEIGAAIMPLLPSTIIRSARNAKANAVCLGWVDWPGAKSLFSISAKICNFKKQIQDAKKLDIFVSGGVANTPKEVEWFCGQGIEGVWTDNVVMALDVIKSL